MRPTKHAHTNYRMLAPYLETVNANGGHFRATAFKIRSLRIKENLENPKLFQSKLSTLTLAEKSK